MTNIFRIFRPELATSTLTLYNKEVNILKSNFDEQDEIDLLFSIIDLSLDKMNLKDLLEGATTKSQRQVRLAVLRNLLDIFDSQVTAKDYEMMDLLILEERFRV